MCSAISVRLLRVHYPLTWNWRLWRIWNCLLKKGGWLQPYPAVRSRKIRTLQNYRFHLGNASSLGYTSRSFVKASLPHLNLTRTLKKKKKKKLFLCSLTIFFFFLFWIIISQVVRYRPVYFNPSTRSRLSLIKKREQQKNTGIVLYELRVGSLALDEVAGCKP